MLPGTRAKYKGFRGFVMDNPATFNSLWPVFLVVGLIFGLVAGVMAFLISYQEYSHHFTDSKKPFMLSLQTGLFTFAFMLALSLLAAYVLTTFVIK